MQPILLLDLDDTLLENSMERFAPAYLVRLAEALGIPVQTMLPFMSAGTNAMMANRQPDLTLKDVFDSEFFPKLGLDLDILQPTIDAFYRDVFPTLKGLTQPRPGGIALVNEALAREYTLVLATNPLFPRVAILERLAWAGFTPETHAFSLIPSYETFHFGKPSPAYYVELLAHLGYPEAPVLMVGDDYEMDILPCKTLGIPTYWVPPLHAKTDPALLNQAWRTGPLEDVLPWLDGQNLEHFILDYNQLPIVPETLRATPAVLSERLQKLPDEQWNTGLIQGRTLTEIICHLRDVEVEVNHPRIQQVLQENNPFIPGLDTDEWFDTRAYPSQNGRAALSTLVQARINSLSILDTLEPRQWELPARHSIFGPTTLQELVSFMAGHDRLHLRQIWRALAQLPESA